MTTICCHITKTESCKPLIAGRLSSEPRHANLSMLTLTNALGDLSCREAVVRGIVDKALFCYSNVITEVSVRMRKDTMPFTNTESPRRVK